MMGDCTMEEDADARCDVHDDDECVHNHPGCTTLEECHARAGC